MQRVAGAEHPVAPVTIHRLSVAQYDAMGPPASAVAMVVEIADISLERDRTLKARVYARARIPTYWIVNLRERCVEVLTGPAGEADAAEYRAHHVVREGEQIVLALEGTALAPIPVAALFGSATNPR